MIINKPKVIGQILIKGQVFWLIVNYKIKIKLIINQKLAHYLYYNQN